MINIPDDIPKYKKKSTRHPPKKSRHKHTYEDCLLNVEYEMGGILYDSVFLSEYCAICGKIGNRRVLETTKETSNGYSRLLNKDEILEKYKHLEIFEIDDFCDKYVTLSKSIN